MDNTDTDLLFPPRVIPQLGNLRGESWQSLVDEVVASGDGTINETAFVLMMVRINGCSSCNSSTFRAMNGCSNCSKQSIKRFRGKDEDLLDSFNLAKIEFENHLNGKE